MQIREKMRLLPPLLALAYLGFYVYGLVVGVFTPGEMLGFSLVAIGLVVFVVLWALALRLHADDIESPTSPHARQVRELRERRGF